MLVNFIRLPWDLPNQEKDQIDWRRKSSKGYDISILLPNNVLQATYKFTLFYYPSRTILEKKIVIVFKKNGIPG